MKRTITLIILLYSISINTYSQKGDSIIYIFPDKVEQKLYEQIESGNAVGYFNFGFLLESINKDEFRIFLTYINNKSNNYWINRTNRFILINKEKYPLIFDYDSLFSTPTPDEVGSFGKREGFILRSLFMYERYNITFDKDGETIKES